MQPGGKRAARSQIEFSDRLLDPDPIESPTFYGRKNACQADNWPRHCPIRLGEHRSRKRFWDDFWNPSCRDSDALRVGLCRKTRSGFERPFFPLAASGCIDDKTNIACFEFPTLALGTCFARRKNCSLSGRRRNSPTRSWLRFAQVLVNSGLY